MGSCLCVYTCSAMVTADDQQTLKNSSFPAKNMYSASTQYVFTSSQTVSFNM